MALNKKSTVEIRQVANGYLVMPPNNYESRGAQTSDEERYVFQTFAELMAWMDENFTHRGAAVAVDGPNVPLKGGPDGGNGD